MAATVRIACFAALAAALGHCASERPLVPLFQLNASSEETAREAARAIAAAGVEVRLDAIRDLPAERVPDWADADGGWLVMGRAEDRKKAEDAYAAWAAEFGKRTPSRPAVEPLALGSRRDLGDDERLSIRAELARRRGTDQAVRTFERLRGQMAQVDADNTAYLRKLVLDVGWIDVERFGRPAADAAFLIVQHSGDLPLMFAALPEIEKDVRAGKGNPQTYALLYDRLQIMTGGKQRYGSQITQNDAGELVVADLEDPDRVDELRKELGLKPLQEYLALFGEDVKVER